MTSSPLFSPQKRFSVVFRLICFLALALSLYLSWVSWNKSPIAGCSGGEVVDCSHVLNSRWASWGFVPVSFMATFLYGTLLGASFFWRGEKAILWFFFEAMAFTILGTALWFTSLQVFILQSFCFYCLGTHLCGILLASMIIWQKHRSSTFSFPAMGLAFLFLLSLVGGQVLWTPPRSVEEKVPEIIDSKHQAKEGKPSENRPRELLLLGGEIRLLVEEYPSLGDKEAPHVMVEFFDYTCPHCRVMHRSLKEVQEKYPQVAILLVPVPLSAGCNKYLPLGSFGQNYDACILARLAWIVWVYAPDDFAKFHQWAMEGKKFPEGDLAQEYVRELIGEDKLREGKKNWEIDDKMTQGIEAFGKTKVSTIPQLFFGKKRINGEVSTDYLFEQLEEEWKLELASLGVEPREISLFKGKIKVQAHEQLLLGSLEAEHLLVEFFDYSCPHCRSMHGRLKSAQVRYGKKALGILLVPIPLHSACNKYVQAHLAVQDYAACKISQLAWSVWNEKKELFPEFHSWLMETEKTRGEKEATEYVKKLIGEEALERQRKDWKVNEQMMRSVNWYGEVGGGDLPQIFLGKTRILGDMGETVLFQRLEKELGIIPLPD